MDYCRLAIVAEWNYLISIPNSEVKCSSAEDTRTFGPGKIGHCQDFMILTPHSKEWGFSFYRTLYSFCSNIVCYHHGLLRKHIRRLGCMRNTESVLLSYSSSLQCGSIVCEKRCRGLGPGK